MSVDVGRTPNPFEEGLSEALASLKRAGSNLLVVGAVTEEASTSTCRRMLGDGEGSRHRLLVLTDSTGAGLSDRLPADCDHAADDVTIIDQAIPSRSTGARAQAAAVETNGTTTPSGPTLAGGERVADRRVDTTNVLDLGNAIVEAIDAIDDDADGLEPSELRVCLDSLLPLLESNGEETVFRFLHVLTGQVRRRRGLAHYHLPVERDSEVAHLLAPLFDAVVELRAQDGAVQQRWNVLEADVTTDWLPV